MFAIEKANGSKFLGQRLHCDFAFTRPPPLNDNNGFKKSKSPPNHRNRSRSPLRRYGGVGRR